jgi:photosystem II stability/assembly factor-like uncharacterized protein
MYFRHFPICVCRLLFFCLIAAGVINGSFAAQLSRVGPFGGDVRSLLIDPHQPEIVYLGTSNGVIFKSLDSGNSWMPLNPGIGHSSYVIDALVPHPAEANHLYAGTWDLHSEGGGLFESRDAGRSWKQLILSNISSAVRGLSICRSKPSYMIAGTLEGAYVSEDGGQSWRMVGGSELQKAESVAIDPLDHRILYVGTWRLGYKSSNFGKTWTLMEKGMPLDSDVFSISIDARNSTTIYSSACSGVYRSTNQARTWTRLRLLPDRFTVRAQVVYLDPVNDQRVYSGTTEGLFVSNDYGQNWMRLTANSVVVNAIQVSPDNNQHILIGTEYQGVLRSEDGGRTWKECNRGFIHQRISWLNPDADRPGWLVAGLGTGRGGLSTYDSQTGAWTPSQILEGMRILSFLILPQNRGRLAGTTQGLFWQLNESKPWTKLKGSIANRTVYSLLADPKNPVVYAGTDQGIYRASLSTMDFRLPPGYRLSPQAWCITAPADGTGLVYAGSSLGLLRSWDRGTIWNVISAYGLPNRVRIESVAVSPADKDHLFAGTSVGLFESTNGGVHWRRAGNAQMIGNIPSVVFGDDSGENILAADRSSGGIFLSKDGGRSWDKLSMDSASPSTCIVVDAQKPSRIYIGTESDGVYRLDLP